MSQAFAEYRKFAELTDERIKQLKPELAGMDPASQLSFRNAAKRFNQLTDSLYRYLSFALSPIGETGSGISKSLRILVVG